MKSNYKNAGCTVSSRVEKIGDYEITFIFAFHTCNCKSPSFSAVIRNNDGSVVFGRHEDTLYELINEISEFLANTKNND